MSTISVLQQQSFLLRLELALITPEKDEEDREQLHSCLQKLSNVPVDSPSIRMVDRVDVPLHVVHIITLVIAHGAGEEPLPLLAMHFAVVDLNTNQRI